MDQRLKSSYFIFAISLLCVTSVLQANILWPTLLAAKAIYSTWFLIAISIAIEAYCFHYYISKISYAKSLMMALVGNLASFALGTLLITESVMAITFALKGWRTLFELLFGGTSDPLYLITTWISMFFTTVLIELGVVKISFRYSTQELYIPILIGNSITYALAALYQYIYA